MMQYVGWKNVHLAIRLGDGAGPFAQYRWPYSVKELM
jgi:hypothetical protein